MLSRQEIEKKIEAFANELSGDCDSVRIFVTVPTYEGDDSTGGFTYGKGNFYASWGSIREWMVTQDERVRENVRREEGGEDEP